jgi:hypothetical protein
MSGEWHAPERIVFIRYAEKPGNGADGVTADGIPDAESLRSFPAARRFGACPGE